MENRNWLNIIWNVWSLLKYTYYLHCVYHTKRSISLGSLLRWPLVQLKLNLCTLWKLKYMKNTFLSKTITNVLFFMSELVICVWRLRNKTTLLMFSEVLFIKYMKYKAFSLVTNMKTSLSSSSLNALTFENNEGSRKILARKIIS